MVQVYMLTDYSEGFEDTADFLARSSLPRAPPRSPGASLGFSHLRPLRTESRLKWLKESRLKRLKEPRLKWLKESRLKRLKEPRLKWLKGRACHAARCTARARAGLSGGAGRRKLEDAQAAGAAAGGALAQAEQLMAQALQALQGHKDRNRP
jgi:hypothetical protein